jgi:citrate lyase beta subunit
LAFVVACTESKDFVTEQAIIAASIIITGVILAIKPAAVDSARSTIERRLKDLPPSVRVHCSSLN